MYNTNSVHTLHCLKHGQVCYPNGTLVKGKKPVLHGGTPYNEVTCNMILVIFLNGNNTSASWLLHHCHQYPFPSLGTCRWIWARYLNNGQVLPKQATESHYATQEVYRRDLINLALFWKVPQRPISTGFGVPTGRNMLYGTLWVALKAITGWFGHKCQLPQISPTLSILFHFVWIFFCVFIPQWKKTKIFSKMIFLRAGTKWCVWVEPNP